MTALSDIDARLADLGPVADGKERAIFLGVAAKRSVIGHAMRASGDYEAQSPLDRDVDHPSPKTIDGVRVIPVDHFPGWAIGERTTGERPGRWIDVATGTHIAAGAGPPPLLTE